MENNDTSNSAKLKIIVEAQTNVYIEEVKKLLRKTEVAGDGNCLFHSIAKQLSSDDETKLNRISEKPVPDALRDIVCEFYKKDEIAIRMIRNTVANKNFDSVKGTETSNNFVTLNAPEYHNDPKTLDQILYYNIVHENTDVNQDFPLHSDNICNPSAYGNVTDTLILSKFFKRNLALFIERTIENKDIYSVDYYHNEEFNVGSTFFILFDGIKHYDAMIPVPDSLVYNDVVTKLNEDPNMNIFILIHSLDKDGKNPTVESIFSCTIDKENNLPELKEENVRK